MGDVTLMVSRENRKGGDGGKEFFFASLVAFACRLFARPPISQRCAGGF